MHLSRIRFINLEKSIPSCGSISNVTLSPFGKGREEKLSSSGNEFIEKRLVGLQEFEKSIRFSTYEDYSGRWHRHSRYRKPRKCTRFYAHLVNLFGSFYINTEACHKRLVVPLKRTTRFYSTHTVSNLKDVANLIKTGKCKNIIVMAGAGISTPSGIPDFRSPGTGLFDNLEEYNLPDPTAVFDIYFFSYNPKPFFRLAKELYPGKYAPNIIHYFIKLLHSKGVLLRMYTQNIDALETVAGIPNNMLIEAHGSFATATCRRCQAKYAGEEILKKVLNKEVPYCRKTGCLGVIKPDIVFFGENLPERFFTFKTDFMKCDLLIVLGTSLEVEPFASLVEEANFDTVRLLINREVVGPFVERNRRMSDIVFEGDIVAGIEQLTSALSWETELENMVKEGEMSFRENYRRKRLEASEAKHVTDRQKK